MYKNLRIPSNLEIKSASQLKLYAAFLWFKGISDVGKSLPLNLQRGIVSYGKAYKSDFSNRNKRNYWAKKLVSAGWIADCGDYYELRSYPHVWESMGIQRVKKRGSKRSVRGYHYTYLDFKSSGDMMRECLFVLQSYLVERKKSQLRRSLSDWNRKAIITKALFSTDSTAKLLGYRSKASGLKYREKFFEVIRVPLKKSRRYCFKTDDIRVMSPCYFVRIDKVFN